MVRKIFALASVSALAGVIAGVGVAGCSDDETNPVAGDDSGIPDASKPDAKKPSTPEDDGGDDPPKSCMVTDAIDPNKYPYAKATAPQGACTTAEVAAIDSYYEKAAGTESVATWKTKVSAECAACVFSDGNGSTWTPIITSGDTLGRVNHGGCVEAQGLPTACGNAYQAYRECELEACTTECKTQAEFDACRKNSDAIFKGPCKAASEKVGKDCDVPKLNAAVTACRIGDWTFDGPIKFMCVDGPKRDAGAGDAGGDDAGDGG